MCRRNFKEKLKDLIIPIGFLLGGLLFWEISMNIFNIPEWLLPKPSQIGHQLFLNPTFFIFHLQFTMTSAVLGFLIANIISLIIGIIFIHSRLIERGIWPWIMALRIAPTLALAPFLIILFGIGMNSKIATAALICFFPLLVNFINGLKLIDRDSLDLFKSFSATQWQLFSKLRIYNSLPFYFTGLKIASASSISGAFIGEFISSNRGIGFLIMVHSRLFNFDTVFAAIVLIIFSGLLFWWLISFIEKKVIFWNNSLD